MPAVLLGVLPIAVFADPTCSFSIRADSYPRRAADGGPSRSFERGVCPSAGETALVSVPFSGPARMVATTVVLISLL